jgi:hypothetical protein
MRKITKQIAEALANGKNKTIGNTATFDGKVYLHGNKIAEWKENGLHMSLAGWNTTTTRERLNGIAEHLGLNVSFNQKNYNPYLNGKLINANDWFNVRELHKQTI